MQNALRQIDLIVYRLKRNYGLTVYLRQIVSSTPNVETGKVVTIYRVTKLRKVPALPSDKIRDFAYDLSYVAANKNFTYGALFDRSIRFFIIDRKDITGEITLSDNLIFESQQYDPIDISPSATNKSYLIKAKALDSTIVEDPYAS